MLKYKIGYALSGGGAKGFAHAGAITALQERNIYPDIISGTSAGAVVAAFYASGVSPLDMCEAFKKREVSDLMKVAMSMSGIFKTTKALEFFRQEIPVKNIEDSIIPLRIVATDFDNGKSVTFTEGELAPRVMASSCVPIVFEPIRIDGVHYVDGGVFKNFPVSNIRQECEFVIGINVSPLVANTYKKNILSIADRSYEFLFRANTFKDKELCDLLVEIEEALRYKAFELKSAQKIYQLGYEQMKAKLDSLDPKFLEKIISLSSNKSLWCK